MISNGYVFSGPKGCGKKLMAFTFAMALNCTAASENKPCGSCSSCVRTQNGNHPNVEIVRPTGQSIKIKQIRQIISDSSKKPFESGYKVIIVE
jgi:DNA polymerase-3 subunit delta'